ncbi:MAG: glycine zipper 2TM domain-containing protein [Polaromonas sp.]
METIQTSASPASAASAPYQPGMSYRLQHSKALIAIVAVLGVTVAALAGALVVKGSNAESGVPAPIAAVTAVPAPAAQVAAVTPKPTVPSTTKHTVQPSTVAQSHALACVNCGTVEAVTAVQRQGQVKGVAVGNTTIGLGTVAGGVLGGLLGHQVGGGNGKNAATLLGAAGGAYAGNTIEKNMKKVTVYDVRVRMADGSHRNLDISTAPAVGSKVIVEGNNLRMANATS